MTITAAEHTRRATAAAGRHTLTPWVKDPTDPATRMTFYLGVHEPRWLETSPVPLFVSRTRLERYSIDARDRGEKMPKAMVPWAMDSGGFTELQRHGTWTIGADEYGGMVTRFIDECGWPPDFVAPQDWMCEEAVIKGGTFKGNRFAGTGLTVAIHQELTVENFVYLRREFDHAPWIPVLQGQTLDDYLSHVEQYAAAGIDLADEHLVGLGSVCRREATEQIATIVAALHARGLRLHGFGVKTSGLALYGQHLASADSLAWSFGARMEAGHRMKRGQRPQLVDTCTHRGPCNNCLSFAVCWRESVLAGLRTPVQDGLALGW